MATFRFTIEVGTDDATLPPAEAEAHIRALREWIMQAPLRKLGTVFVSDVEINPTAVTEPHPVMITQGGFTLSEAENVARAMFRVWGYLPKIESIQAASSGIWLVPIPLHLMSGDKFEWFGPDGIRIMISA
jgi:hypothetical protein